MAAALGRRTAWLFVCAVMGLAGHAGADEAEVRKLREEKVAVLQDVVRGALAMHEQGTASYDDVASAQRQLLAAELEAATTVAQRLALLEKALAVAKEQEARADKAYLAGRMRAFERSRAKVGRIQLQIDLAVERDKLAGK
ncbi:MAG: TolC family protein [Phycisphaerae bacterium]|nr:TolC family protein [Tepidisphaeraceae bacterium]